MSIDETIKKMNTANVLLDAFGDGHEFTMHDYEELTNTINELFGAATVKIIPATVLVGFVTTTRLLVLKKSARASLKLLILVIFTEPVTKERLERSSNLFIE